MPKHSDVSPLFVDLTNRRRRVLILPKYLFGASAENLAEQQAHFDDGAPFETAREIFVNWAKMERDGRLKKKETSLDANFLNEVFGKALRFVPVERAQEGAFTLDRQLHVPNVGSVDGALGIFPADPGAPKPVAVIELKGADTDLDTDKSNGRTAVQQLFDYLNALPETQWGIVSNFSTIRLYHKSSNQSYEVFSLQDIAAKPEVFKAFWCLFEKGGLLPSALRQVPRSEQLRSATGERQKTVGNELYNLYSLYRNALIATLRDDFQKPLDEAIRIAQKIFDRIIFIAFCEDRGLVETERIKHAYNTPRPFARIKNPRWKNFVDLFHGIDEGHPDLGITYGYNGGLFKEDPGIDELELPDEPWTTAFNIIGGYEFRDEVNVDVLGHIFERSITELEKLRLGGLFDKSAAATSPSKMQKSAERKKFGIYYTPPEFTRFIVEQTVGELLAQRFGDLEKAHNVTPDQLAANYANLTPNLAAYYQQCLHVLRNFKVVDPACGSGAFLIAAYECLVDFYEDIVRHLIAQDVKDAQKLPDLIPDFILKQNLYGVDLSEEAVEITRLALWIRSARPGKTLADLSHNIVCGNSLVDDVTVHPRAMDWKITFPAVFERESNPGFDAVVGNPPWERMKVQNKDFFGLSSPEIIAESNPAKSRKLIADLENGHPELYKRYIEALDTAEKTSDYVRGSGRYPLTSRGDINTYMLFAELARALVAPSGRVGLLVPSGIATDNTTKEFFADLIDSQCLIKLFDFENRLGIFPDVDGRFKFCTLVLGGSQVKTPNVDFVFFAHSIIDLESSKRHIPLSKKDVALFNPNTKTCPIFRSRKDSDLTRFVYRRIPVLIEEGRRVGGNPWEISYHTLFHQSGSAELFKEPQELKKQGLSLQGNVWTASKHKFLPLYEAKMIQAYDHRAASVTVQSENWVRQGQTVETSAVEHQNPEYSAMPRWWVDQTHVTEQFKESIPPALLAFKNITSSTNQRTMIAAFIPFVGVIDSAPVIRFGKGIKPTLQACLLASLNCIPFDYIARQKVGGNHLSYFVVNQLPTLAPDTYADKCPWAKKQTLEQWISERVLKLTCTANDMIPLAKACNFNPKGSPAYVWKWKEQERAELRAQLDAAYFHLYGLSRDDAAYILSTFQATGEPADAHSTTSLILSYFDEYAKA